MTRHKQQPRQQVLIVHADIVRVTGQSTRDLKQKAAKNVAA
jgi:hypothetical protein